MSQRNDFYQHLNPAISDLYQTDIWCPEFLLNFQEQCEEDVLNFHSQRWPVIKKKSIICSFKMQQACEGKDSFEFSLSLYKQVSKLKA